jgi:alpha-tubulin suppressor-like RCC1 family protein
MLSNGSLWAWGSDRFAQLGDGKTGIRRSPVQFRPPAGVTYARLATGSATSYAISTTGKVYAWGVSVLGQVGDGQTSPARAPVLVASQATSISATANDVVISVASGHPNPVVRGLLAAPDGASWQPAPAAPHPQILGPRRRGTVRGGAAP